LCGSAATDRRLRRGEIIRGATTVALLAAGDVVSADPPRNNSL
jgi:hypothetical protein